MDNIRNGNFTSSEIFNLLSADKKGVVGNGKPALTYIAEKNMERRVKLPLENESNAKPLSWGKLLESRINNLLPTDYIIYNDITFVHPEYSFWVGSPDLEKFDTSCDTKCPITRKSFCQLVDPLYEGLDGIEAMNKIIENHKDGFKYFYQIVSNAIIRGKEYGELIVYMPYKSELEAIKNLADGNRNYYWIWAADNEELPYLEDNGYYKNINIIRFKIPEIEKEKLTKAVINASKFLHTN